MMMFDTKIDLSLSDKLHLSLIKLSNKQGKTLDELISDICSDWISNQDLEIKGVYYYPEYLLDGLSAEDRKSVLNTVANGGFKYNENGSACFDEDDDGEYDYEYDELYSDSSSFSVKS